MYRLRHLAFPVAALVACNPQPSVDEVSSGYVADPSNRPNVVVIVVDDLRFDEIGVAGHPFIETPNIDALASQGAMFTSAFHVVPLCSPNRASILTGQYPSRHGIIDNVARSRRSHQLQTFPRDLQEDGYATAFFGKWHMGNDPTPRPGFDVWAAIPGQGRTRDPELYEDGRIHTVRGYITDVLTDKAIAFMDEERDRPFFVYIGHKAIHPDAIQLDDGSVDRDQPAEYVPPPRHRGRYENVSLPARDNVMSRHDVTGKPALQNAFSAKFTDEMVDLFGAELEPSEEVVRRRAEMLLAVDDGLGRIVDYLRTRGILDNTLVVFTSDNGFFYGEHGLSLERRLPYEESIKTPLIMRFPAVATAGSIVDDIVASIDVAPTVLEITGTPVTDHVQGRSVVPLLTGNPAGWRESLLIEFFTYENPFPWLVDMDYRAIRTERYKYIHWMQHPNDPELYDLLQDPFELSNVVEEPALVNVRQELRATLAREVVRAMGIDR